MGMLSKYHAMVLLEGTRDDPAYFDKFAEHTEAWSTDDLGIAAVDFLTALYARSPADALVCIKAVSDVLTQDALSKLGYKILLNSLYGRKPTQRIFTMNVRSAYPEGTNTNE
jgi:hypothetical protein